LIQGEAKEADAQVNTPMCNHVKARRHDEKQIVDVPDDRDVE